MNMKSVVFVFFFIFFFPFFFFFFFFVVIIVVVYPCDERLHGGLLEQGEPAGVLFVLLVLGPLGDAVLRQQVCR